jgi:hypothetical protein
VEAGGAEDGEEAEEAAEADGRAGVVEVIPAAVEGTQAVAKAEDRIPTKQRGIGLSPPMMSPSSTKCWMRSL